MLLLLAVIFSNNTQKCSLFYYRIVSFPCVCRILIVSLWVIRGDAFFNNLIGVFITISALSLLRIQNLKVIVVAFTLLFLYDIFWVFYSEYFFGKNVMVTVANQNFTQPVATSICSPSLSWVVAKSLGRNVSSSYHLDFPVFPCVASDLGKAHPLCLGKHVLPRTRRHLRPWSSLCLFLPLPVYARLCVLLFDPFYVAKQSPGWWMWSRSPCWLSSRTGDDESHHLLQQNLALLPLPSNDSHGVHSRSLSVCNTPLQEELRHGCDYWEFCRTSVKFCCSFVISQSAGHASFACLVIACVTLPCSLLPHSYLGKGHEAAAIIPTLERACRYYL